MAISKDNVIYVYNLSSSDSIQSASYYASIHNMNTVCTEVGPNSGILDGIAWEVHGQLVGIGLTGSSEILSGEVEFNEQFLNPLKYALENSVELLSMSIWGIVLGYNTPGGFISGVDIISSTSRISRIFNSFDKKVKNKLYNRSIFERFGEEDSEIALLCSRIDAPSLLIAQSIMDNSEDLQHQVFVSGKFYVDPYSDKAGSLADSYRDLILSFQEEILPSLNLDTWGTTYMDPYIDSSIPYVMDDSFVWSWFSDRGNSSFFKTTTSKRVFFYNADYDSAYSVRNEDEKRWCYLALSHDYVCSAGAMSSPSFDGFLNPISFFNALLRGATVGEAYLFSLPYFDWTMTLFGDLLSSCVFPSNSVPEVEVISEHEAWDSMSKDLSRTLANLYKKGLEVEAARFLITGLTSMDEYSGMEIATLYQLNDLDKISNDMARNSQLGNVVQVLLNFPQRRYMNMSSNTLSPFVDTYLTEQGFKISLLLSDTIGITSRISHGNLLPEGWWQFEFLLADNSSSYIYYHFILDISDTSDFSNILYTKNSLSVINWTYEKDQNVFLPVPFDGVPSSHIGRKIRYESRYDDLLGVNEYLTRGETYYFRITQYNAETFATYAPRIDSDIIYS